MIDDDIDLLRSARPWVEPTVDVRVRHRTESQQVGRTPSRRVGVALGDAFAGAAATIVFLAVAQRNSDRVTTIAPPATEPALVTAPAEPPAASTTVPPPAFRCGATLPFEVELASKFSGPRQGPAPLSQTRPAADQLVMHWLSDTTVYELRWPMDKAVEQSLAARREAIAPGASGPGLPTYRSRGVLDDRFVSTGTIPLTREAANACDSVQLTVIDVSQNALDESELRFINHARRAPGSPLVAETRSVSALPIVIPCQGFGTPGVDFVYRREGSVEMPGQPMPREAVRWFGRELAPLGMPLSTGLIEFVLPDGSYAYGRRLSVGSGGDSSDRFVGMVDVRLAADGWRVTMWRSSGC